MRWDDYPDEPIAKGGRLLKSGISAAALMAKQFDPVRYIVPGYIAEGVTLFAGAPKIGKSWWALGVALSVASQSPAFGSVACEHGDVLYLALEDNERRLKKRMLHMGIVIPPARLTFHTQWPTLDEDCIDELEAWILSTSEPALIVIDVLAKIRPAANGRDQIYDADYRAITGLQRLASTYSLAVLVVHHTRKMEAEDPFDSVSGSRGLTGAADTVLVLKRDIGTARNVLYGRGRDIEEIETAFEFKRDNGTWKEVGAASEVAKTSERQGILDTLKGMPKPLSAREISDILGRNYEAVRKCLTRMAHAGEIEKTGRGLYACPNSPFVSTEALFPSKPDIGTLGTQDIIKSNSAPSIASNPIIAPRVLFPPTDDDPHPFDLPVMSGGLGA